MFRVLFSAVFALVVASNATAAPVTVPSFNSAAGINPNTGGSSFTVLSGTVFNPAPVGSLTGTTGSLGFQINSVSSSTTPNTGTFSVGNALTVNVTGTSEGAASGTAVFTFIDPNGTFTGGSNGLSTDAGLQAYVSSVTGVDPILFGGLGRIYNFSLAFTNAGGATFTTSPAGVNFSSDGQTGAVTSAVITPNFFPIDVPNVPEPATMATFALIAGFGGLAARRKFQQKTAA